MFRVIIHGQLEFGKQQRYETALEQFEHRVENYYKNTCVFELEEQFDADTHMIRFHKYIRPVVTSKQWKMTVHALEFLSGYSMAGYIDCFKLNEGEVLEHVRIQPTGDRSTVQNYLRGLTAIEEGDYTAALPLFKKAYRKYDHALAYERSGYAQFMLGNYDEAIEFYDKSLAISKVWPDAHFGRGLIYMKRGEMELAVRDFNNAIEASVARNPLHYEARRRKAMCLYHLRDFEGAIRELHFFTIRKFVPGGRNDRKRRSALYLYGKALLKLERWQEAEQMFDQALKIEAATKDGIDEAKLYMYRGISRRNIGKTGYRSDLNKARKAGLPDVEEKMAAYHQA